MSSPENAVKELMPSTDEKIKELKVAIEACDVEKVAALVKAGVNLETTDPERNRTPLLLAGALRREQEDKSKIEALTKIINILVDAKANIRHKDDIGSTILHLLIVTEANTPEDLTLCTKLIDMGADVNAIRVWKTEKDAENDASLLMYAIYFRKFDIALLLIEKNANVNHLGSNYLNRYEPKTALMELVGTCHMAPDFTPNFKVLSALLEAGADVNQIGYKDQNVLFHVLNIIDQQPRNALLSILLKHGANVLQKDSRGGTPIKMALGFGQDLAVQMMLGKVDPTSEDSKELFDTLAKFGNTEGLQKLYDECRHDHLMADTFKKVGDLTGSLLMPTVFGHGSEYYFRSEGGYDYVTSTAVWFLRYLDSKTVLDSMKTRKIYTTAGGLDFSDLPRPRQEMIKLLIKIQGPIYDAMVEEMLQRIEIEMATIPGNNTLLFMHPSSSQKLDALAEVTSQKMECSKEKITDTIKKSAKYKKRAGLLPYWTLAERNKESSEFRFCKLPSVLKAKILSFLEPKPPLSVAMLPKFHELLNARLNSAQQQVTQREKDRPIRKFE